MSAVVSLTKRITMAKSILPIAICWVLSQVLAAAQIHPNWSFDKLQADADVVVVATPLSTRDSGRRIESTELSPPVPVIELNTEFRVLSTVSGQIGPSFVLKHYKLDDTRLSGGCLNCGAWIEFSAAAPSTKLCRVGDVSPNLPTQCNYLMYLKRGATGVYEPVSGHAFPGMSIFLLRRAS